MIRQLRVVGEQHRRPQRRQLPQDGGVALHEGLHQGQEVQVHHLSQHLGVGHQLEDAGGDLKHDQLSFTKPREIELLLYG